MTTSYDMNDDSVVVVIGSGAGGGTLANELTQKGVKTLVLEAGGRHEINDFSNDEWGMFGQISWLDKRTTSGNWRVAKDFAGLPAWIVKAVGGSTVHWAGASLRFQEREFSVRSEYGNIPGANLLDWPITLTDLEPYYAKAEDKMGVTRTNGIPGLPGNNNFKVMKAGADKLGYQNCHTGRMAINSQPRDGREMVDSLRGNSQGRSDRQAGSATQQSGAEDRAQRRGQGNRRLVCRPGWQPARAEGAGRVRCRQLHRVTPPVVELRFQHVPRRARQLIGSGGQELHAPHDGLRVCGVRQAGEHVSGHHDG